MPFVPARRSLAEGWLIKTAMRFVGVQFFFGGDELHAAFRTHPGLVGDNFRMHRTGIGFFMFFVVHSPPNFPSCAAWIRCFPLLHPLSYTFVRSLPDLFRKTPFRHLCT